MITTGCKVESLKVKVQQIQKDSDGNRRGTLCYRHTYIYHIHAIVPIFLLENIHLQTERPGLT